jgi:hypothetical protein
MDRFKQPIAAGEVVAEIFMHFLVMQVVVG